MCLHNWEIAICDDEIFLANQVKEICEAFFITHNLKGKCSVFTSPEKLLQAKQKFDFLFLDVEMPEMDGFQVAKALREKDAQVYVIFLTFHQSRMAEAFGVKAFRYLLKPINETDIYQAMSDVIEEIGTTTHMLIPVKNQEIVVNIKDILYLEAIGEEVIIYLMATNYIVREPLKKWKEKLPKDRFFQTHKSFLVNLAYVKSVGKNTLLLNNGLEIPMSRRQRKGFLDALHCFIRKYAK